MNILKTNQNKNTDINQRRSLLEWLGHASVLIFLLGLALLVRGGSIFNSETTFTNTSEIVNKKNEFIGKSVTIKSRTIEKVGLRSFTVSDQQLFDGEPIVVINASSLPFDLPIDQNLEVQVTGQVRNLVIPKIEREFNLNIKDEYYTDYINKPAIIAQYLTLSSQPGQITQNPEQYYGRKVTVTGEVANIRSGILLTLDENQLFGGEDLLVLLTAPPQVAINQGQTVSAMGEVRRFVAAEIERDYNFTWSLDTKRKLDAEYINRPVLVAETVYPS
ncbi:hypothetical protein H6G41_11650 [Tolypothrix sp. FACHB-123]|uniref:hypothetical protein n=1 Tax=Tolypothrix sp. FACHB-123 TaxID=2692868 RepID=UPI0016827876|nr:hypothetical protein [Tolypothrix sp. FACHB-123]MBD2355265.1 hypothetical protein [Tolypothrix sp. FACHB-123]